MDRSSGSMKLRALAMAMNTSSFTRSGTPCLRIHSVTVSLSCSSTYFWPKMMAGSRPMANWIFSGHVNIWLLLRMAMMPFHGAGISGKSKRLNSPGRLGMAKIMECSFHCSLFSMFSSLNRFWMLGYAPKKMCRPVSYQSPSSSFQAATLPPSTFLPSKTIGIWPASDKYLAADNPARPAPIMTTFKGLAGRGAARSLAESAAASW
mmetsp:Transcript_32741/g.72329  ORF Transcript_32741/g.72329 Transcript_32741/m.72329 type:complete len:206 (+) Transcript_32741:1644-2261(+)